MKSRYWVLILSVACLVVSACRALFGQPPSLLRPPLSEAELGL